VGIIQGIAGSFNPFAIRPSYIPLERLSPKERIERMRDPALRAQLLSEEPSERQLARLSSPIKCRRLNEHYKKEKDPVVAAISSTPVTPSRPSPCPRRSSAIACSMGHRPRRA
jgi:hypothetical protein